MIDITWPVVIILLIGSGIWTKWKNTQHIRRMVAESQQSDCHQEYLRHNKLGVYEEKS